MSSICNHAKTQKGFNLLEILIAIVIFSIGMLALVQLQGGLTRSASDAGVRTVAANIAESAFERARSFSRLTTDPDGTERAYADIATGTASVYRGGINFAVASTVSDYYYSGTTFTKTKPTGVLVSDFKLVQIDVTWDGSSKFQTSSGTEVDLGSGAIRMSNIISSVTSGGDSKSVAAGGDNLYNPDVNYSPGSRPDVISIALGNNKFKESTVPLPDIYREEELVETTFDVVTYSQHLDGATFLRREEFRSVSCECTLKAAGFTGKTGRRPTIWNGVDYSEGEKVAKTYGVVALTEKKQSLYCTQCCRDHHDGGTGGLVDGDPGRSRFDPFKSSDQFFSEGTFAGDHKHYGRNGSDGLELADADGDPYVEACRLVRKDGFFKVAQDLRNESLNNFPEGYLEDDVGVGVYSGYVTSSVSGYVEAIGDTNNYEAVGFTLVDSASMDPPIVFPASTQLNPTILPIPGTGATSQQLQSRGIYLDYMSDEVRAIVTCMDDGGSGEDCGAPKATNSLEVIPFYDVQLTWLARWEETPTDQPVSVTNAAIENNNAHSRGFAAMTSGFGLPEVKTTVHKGNLGLTGTDPIDPVFSSNVQDRKSWVLSQNLSTPTPTNGIFATGSITSAVGGVKAADVTIEPTGALCDRTLTGFECEMIAGANSTRLKVTNYQKANKTLVACSTVLEVHGSENGANNWTRFTLPEDSTYGVSIIIKEGAC